MTTPNPVDLHVGLRLRARRRELGISQDTLAAALGLTFQQVQKYERGTNRVSASKLYAIALTLRAPVSYFFNGLPDYMSPADTDAVSEPGVLRLAAVPRGPDMAEAFLKLSPAQQGVLVSLARQLGGAVDEEPET